VVAAHFWVTHRAQSAGFTAGLITRPGNAPLSAHRLPQPQIVAVDVSAFADQLIATLTRVTEGHQWFLLVEKHAHTVMDTL
jgi:hypothetical protein